MVKLPHLKPLPPLLTSLTSGVGCECNHFLDNSWGYNCALQLASSGIHTNEVHGHVKHLRIQGGIYHLIGALNPDEGRPPQFAQLYIYDNEHELQNRGNVMGAGLDIAMMSRLQTMLHEHNAYVISFRTVASLANGPNLCIVLKASNSGLDTRCYNLPVADEVAAIFPGDGNEEVGPRDVVV